MDLSTEEFIQFFGLSIAAACALYLLGNYGADGDFEYDGERYFKLFVMIVGISSLLGTAIWKFAMMIIDMRQEEAESQQRQDEASSEDVMLL